MPISNQDRIVVMTSLSAFGSLRALWRLLPLTMPLAIVPVMSKREYSLMVWSARSFLSRSIEATLFGVRWIECLGEDEAGEGFA